MESLEKQGIKGVIGLEIHVYLVTREKLFCRCRAVREKGTKPNTFICPICCGMPGAKPMLPNKTAVEKAIQIGLMLNCKINEKLEWKRKHYDWPDLPKGYQNTISGAKAFPVGVNGNFLGIRIKEMHLEEDPASWEPSTGRLDYNRSGFPLIEIVTEPDFSTAEEVKDWLKKLIHSLEYLKAVASDSGIKADVNVSLASPRKTERVEIKNVNSIDNISEAIEFEFVRQTKEGSMRETRRFDEAKEKTIKMRGKEEEQDYRFISDPDLQNIVLNKSYIVMLKKKIPESPEEKLQKLIKKYKIEKKDAEVLSKNLNIVEFFEEIVERGKIEPEIALYWVTVELLGMLNYNKSKLEDIEIRAEDFIELLEEMKRGRITEAQGKKIIQEFYPKSFSLREKNVGKKIGDKKEIASIVNEVLEEELDAVEKYKNGDDKVLNYLVGQVMKKTKGRADVKIVRETMQRLLK